MAAADYAAMVIDAIREGRTREGYDKDGNLVVALRDGERLIPLATLVSTPPTLLEPPSPIAA